LDSILKCYDEETFDDSTADSDNESEYEDLNESDDEEITLENLYKDPLKPAQDRESFAYLAENYLKLVKNSQGRSLKNIGLDVYTISEMLRLYFLTSASSHHSKTKFWYQQRGGYTRMDETGIDFVLNESDILKKLETQNVYELEPEEKLKILTCLCHQVIISIKKIFFL
jgi:bromodomain adjacent to zinc finger domain protein 1A